jgi:hypothetical protein
MTSLEKAKLIVKQGNCRGVYCYGGHGCPIQEEITNNYLPASYCKAEEVRQDIEMSECALDYLKEYIAKEEKMEGKKEEFVAGEKVLVSDESQENTKEGDTRIYLCTIEDEHWCVHESEFKKAKQDSPRGTLLALLPYKYLAKVPSSKAPRDVGIKDVMAILEEKFGCPVKIVKEE